MYIVSLPVSKSIANRLLVLQAMHGDPLTGVSDASIPKDVRLLHDALEAIDDARRNNCPPMLRLELGNCGTAMRFLTAYCAQVPMTFVLDGEQRMRERPIGQEVNALRQIGADIAYLEKEGFPPLRINGRELEKRVVRMGGDPEAFLQSTQFVSALLLTGIEVDTEEQSPYIAMTRKIVREYEASNGNVDTERDWSSAAFWFEYVALHGGEIFLEGLQPSSMQGDQCAADIFAQLGVQTTYVCDPQRGVLLTKDPSFVLPETLAVDFSGCPDLYLAVAITCEQLGIRLAAQGTERLPLKESNRLQSVREHETHHDHRVAMALLAADLPCDDTACIAKSYPLFVNQLSELQHTGD